MQAHNDTHATRHAAATHLYEKTLGSRTAFQGRALRLDVLDIELPDGRRSTREIVRHPGAVAVLARLPDGRFLFVRQYRKAIEQAFVEAVAGGLDPGEAPDEAAHRELREESGYDARRLLPLGSIVACPGYSEERLHLFYAELEERPGATAQDHDENVESLTLAPEAVEQAFLDGTITDAKTMACWLLWKLRGPRHYGGA
ncbi:MAG: NUDIX hydrolase [Kiritimatiellae bacterium]|nr:NUDIX hydrolase [Kiritimatiellia bacterium]